MREELGEEGELPRLDLARIVALDGLGDARGWGRLRVGKLTVEMSAELAARQRAEQLDGARVTQDLRREEIGRLGPIAREERLKTLADAARHPVERQRGVHQPASALVALAIDADAEQDVGRISTPAPGRARTSGHAVERDGCSPSKCRI